LAHPGISPDEAFQQLRARARSSARKLADLAQEVVQDAQCERIAAMAVDDARVQPADERDGVADERTRIADQRERAANARDRTADES
jgi:ANTAR domain-containing protein